MQSDGTMTGYEYRKMQNRCTACSTIDAYTLAGRSLCAKCSDKNNDRIRERYREDPLPKLSAQKRQKDMLRESGICIQCGKRSVANDPKHTRCEVCRALNRRRYHEKTGIGRDTANQCGLCIKCMKPLEDPSVKMCRECTEKMNETARQGRESLRAACRQKEWEKCWIK